MPPHCPDTCPMWRGTLQHCSTAAWSAERYPGHGQLIRSGQSSGSVIILCSKYPEIKVSKQIRISIIVCWNLAATGRKNQNRIKMEFQQISHPPPTTQSVLAGALGDGWSEPRVTCHVPASAKHADMGQLIGHAILCPLAVISDRMLCSVLLSDGETIKDSTRSSCTGQLSLFGVVSNFRPLSNSLLARDEVPQRSVSADAARQQHTCRTCALD